LINGHAFGNERLDRFWRPKSVSSACAFTWFWLLLYWCRTVYRAATLVLGWSFFAFLAYKTAGAKIENKVYDPFEILGLSTVSVHFFWFYIMGLVAWYSHLNCTVMVWQGFLTCRCPSSRSLLPRARGLCNFGSGWKPHTWRSMLERMAFRGQFSFVSVSTESSTCHWRIFFALNIGCHRKRD
jgi:hypothetical protein